MHLRVIVIIHTHTHSLKNPVFEPCVCRILEDFISDHLWNLILVHTHTHTLCLQTDGSCGEGTLETTSLLLCSTFIRMLTRQQNKIWASVCVIYTHTWRSAEQVFTSKCQDTGPCARIQARTAEPDVNLATFLRYYLESRYLSQQWCLYGPRLLIFPFLLFCLYCKCLALLLFLCVSGFYDAADHAAGQRPHQILRLLHQNPGHDVSTGAGFRPATKWIWW